MSAIRLPMVWFGVHVAPNAARQSQHVPFHCNYCGTIGLAVLFAFSAFATRWCFDPLALGAGGI
jgi:hypothetical protein